MNLVIKYERKMNCLTNKCLTRDRKGLILSCGETRGFSKFVRDSVTASSLTDWLNEAVSVKTFNE